jgi:hypothetical protein
MFHLPGKKYGHAGRGHTSTATANKYMTHALQSAGDNSTSLVDLVSQPRMVSGHSFVLVKHSQGGVDLVMKVERAVISLGKPPHHLLALISKPHSGTHPASGSRRPLTTSKGLCKELARQISTVRPDTR